MASARTSTGAPGLNEALVAKLLHALGKRLRLITCISNRSKSTSMEPAIDLNILTLNDSSALNHD